MFENAKQFRQIPIMEQVPPGMSSTVPYEAQFAPYPSDLVTTEITPADQITEPPPYKDMARRNLLVAAALLALPFAIGLAEEKLLGPEKPVMDKSKPNCGEKITRSKTTVILPDNSPSIVWNETRQPLPCNNAAETEQRQNALENRE